MAALSETRPAHLPDLPGHVYSHRLAEGAVAEVHFYRPEVGAGPGTVLKMVGPVEPASGVALDRVRFQREVRTLRGLTHPHVLPLLDDGEFGGRAYFTTPFCAGGNLRQFTEGQRPLPVERVWELLEPVLAALEYLNSAAVDAMDVGGRTVPATGVVHRDVRPENILVADVGGRPVVQLADYGLAKAYEFAGHSGISDGRTLIGSCEFMSRRQLLAFRDAGPEVDAWAAAAVFYWLLTDGTPRDFPVWCDPFEVVAEAPVLPVRDRNPDVPPVVAAVLDRCLDEDDEGGRVRSAADLRRSLRSILGGSGGP